MKEYESLIETEKKSYEYNFFLLLSSAYKKFAFKYIGSFPFRSLICQYNQMNFYSCQQSHNDTYIIERFQSVNDSKKVTIIW